MRATITGHRSKRPATDRAIAGHRNALSIDNIAIGFALGTKTGERGELLGGLVLIAVDLAVASGIL